jgi:hypothetical protein
VIFDVFDWLIPYGRKQRKLLHRGESLQGTVVGIRRRSDGDGGERWEFALDVEAPEGIRRAGVRQKGINQSGSARLGARLPVRSDGRRTIIDLGPNLVYGDWKSLNQPPEPGIRDDLIDVSKGDPLTVEILGWDQSTVMGLPTQNLDMSVRAQDGSEQILKRQIVPAYARHLLQEGGTIPAVVHKGKVKLDWARAATTSP